MPYCIPTDYERNEDKKETCIKFVEPDPFEDELREREMCIDHSLDHQHPNAECFECGGRTVCVDEHGNKVHCNQWSDDEIRQCREDYGIDPYFKYP